VEAQSNRRHHVRVPGRGPARPLEALVLLVAAGALAACSVAAGAVRTGSTSSPTTVGRAKGHQGRGDARSGGTGTSPTRLESHLRIPGKRPAAFGVGLSIATWTETDGSTENFYEGTTEPGRTLEVEILYPTLGVKAPAVKPWAPPAYRYGPYPVIVFAHGFDVDPNTYRALLVSWVEAGYVVVAPFFPDTSLPAVQAQHGADTEYDMFNQPGDVAFVVSQVAGAAHGSPPPYAAYLEGLVDPDRLVLAGQSDGADTVAALLYDHEYARARASMAVQPVAVALLSGAEWARSEDVYGFPRGSAPAALVVQSLTDSCNDPADSSQLYNMLTGPKWFLALEDATHLGPYVGDGAGALVVERVTTDFFDLETGRAKATPAILGQEGDRPGVSTISSTASVPLYPAPAWVPGACSPPPGAPAD
jgi:dienelactone hydrolase